MLSWLVIRDVDRTVRIIIIILTLLSEDTLVKRLLVQSNEKWQGRPLWPSCDPILHSSEKLNNNPTKPGGLPFHITRTHFRQQNLLTLDRHSGQCKT